MDGYRNQLASAVRDLNAFLRKEHNNEYAHESRELKEQWVDLMQKICNIIRDAEQANLTPAQLQELVRTAEPILDKGIEYCYTDESDVQFDSVPSFAHTSKHGSSPIVKDTNARLGTGILDSFVSFMAKAGFLQHPLPPQAEAMMKGPESWYKLTQPFTNSTPLSRFYDNLPGLSYTTTTLNAQSVLQASCEIASDWVANPVRMSLSSSGSILAVAGMSGWKERSPSLQYAWFDGDDDGLDVRSGEVGLSDIGRQVETDEERKLIFIADGDRIKSYDWSALENPAGTARGRRAKDLLSKHTMRSSGCEGPLIILPNGRLARAGKGKVAVWALDGLQTHGAKGTGVIGKKRRVEDEAEMTSRDDPEDIELSSGSPSTQAIRFSFDSNYDIGTWALHPSNPSTVLCAQDSMTTRKYGMVMVDLEAGGTEVGRFLGHGATVSKITTQGPGGHVFCTGCSDGLARLYDVRQSLPVLTVEGDCNEGACTAVLAYPDGIPVIFTGATANTQCIRTWDVRAKAAVYELATGNNGVEDLAWDGTRNTLYAATSCPGRTRMGDTLDYRRAKIPKVQLGRFGFPGPDDGCWEEDDDDDDDGKSWVQEDDDAEAQYCWPEKAYNAENYFGYTFDAGMHSLFRYKFSQNANVDITPGYGQATIERNDYW
ncbi:hypothetical protein VKT23_000066 [Stygiomarasmius scandens]|uniref:Uncharacterized protein n=1 Tax=Marasmiellus scandens TaxID=2682957 RepID=A0ABR1K3G2_9AGAR